VILDLRFTITLVTRSPGPDFGETQKNCDRVNTINEIVIFSLLTIENNQKATHIRFHSVTLDNITKNGWHHYHRYIQYTYIVENIKFILTSFRKG